MYARLASNSLCGQERPRILGFLASTFQVLGLQMWETTDVCATSDGLNYSVWCSASEQARIRGKSLYSSGDTRNAVSYTHKKNLKEETGIEVKPQSLKYTQEARGSMRTIQLTNICALCHRHGTRHSCQTKRITSYFKMRSEKVHLALLSRCQKTQLKSDRKVSQLHTNKTGLGDLTQETNELSLVSALVLVFTPCQHALINVGLLC